MKQINASVAEEREAFFQLLDERTGETNQRVTETVQEILKTVKAGGDDAVKNYTLKFDGSLPEYYEVPREVINDALTDADQAFVDAMLNAIENVRDFHQRQVEQGFIHPMANGVILGQRVRGLERVGLYVPGGTAAYPSSVIMNAVPAKIAGVKEIIMVTPPRKDGTPNPDILIAAALCGVDRIFLSGGAQAIAALAYGTKEIPKVDKIVGPGNIYVATAKKLLYGIVDIDMIAGPSEVLVMADETANPAFAAADLMSQAEHDVMASSILVTTSEKLAEQVQAEINRQVQTLERKVHEYLRGNSALQQSRRSNGSGKSSCTGTLGSADGESNGTVGCTGQRWLCIPWTVCIGTVGGLLCWPEPRSSDQWNGSVLLSAGRCKLYKAFQLYVLYQGCPACCKG